MKLKGRIYKTSLPSSDPKPWKFSVHDIETQEEFEHGAASSWWLAIAIVLDTIEDITPGTEAQHAAIAMHTCPDCLNKD